MAYGPSFGMIDEETPEDRRMRLLREMNPFTPRPGTGESGTIGSSGSAFGMMPQGMMADGQTYNTPERGTFVDNGAPRSSGPAWRDPGSDAPATVYQDPPVPGILATKVGEPSRPELDGILFGGTRSAPGMDAFVAAKPRDSAQLGPEVAAPGMNVTGANGSDRTNVPRSPDALANAPAPTGFPTPARRQPRAVIEGGTSPSPASMMGAPGATPAASKAPGAVLSPSVAAAAADGLSRTPGSPDAMNWLKENADLFIGLGAGLLSGKNIGEGILHGLKMANETRVANAKEKELLRKNQAAQLQTAAFAAMAKQAYPDISNEQAIAIAGNNAMMQEVFKTQHPSEQWQQQGGGEAGQAGFLKNIRTGDIKADPSRPAPPDKTRTLPPEEVAKIPGADPKFVWQEQADGTLKVVGQPGQTINVNTGQDKLVEQAADLFKGHLSARDSAQNTLRATQAMREQLNAPGGIIAGAGAGDRLSLQKLGALLGVADPSAVTNTESFKAAAGPLVQEIVKTLGKPTDSDLKFAEKSAGGDLTLDESSIRRMIDLRERKAMEDMQRSQGVIDQLVKVNPNLQALAPMLAAPLPEARPPAASQAAPPTPMGGQTGSAGVMQFDRNGRRIR